MLAPVKWLKEYIKIDADTRLIADKVTDSGSHVEGIETINKGVSGIKTGKILKISPHDSMKKLSIVDLDMGDGKLKLVTGAKNMEEGDIVVVAGLGAKLPGGIEIKEADFGNVKSPGMLCSYGELGQKESVIPKESKDGIIILPKEIEAGLNAFELLGLDDEVIEFEITPNRPDCLSIIGMAREVAAVFQEKLKYPDVSVKNSIGNIKDEFSGLRVESEYVPRFTLGLVKDVKIKQSPLKIQNYLRAAGIRPINNIVDITNFIMLEYGQPMHAYDMDKIKGNKLIIRQAKNDETLITLDENKRILNEEDILICDGNNDPIGIAGIMGGLDTEVTSNTVNVLIEAANFDPDKIKLTSKRLQLRSEASSKFEKGLPEELTEIAINRFFNLVENTESGKVVKGLIDFTKEEKTSIKTIRLRRQRLVDLLGVDLSLEEAKRYLESLELYVETDENSLIVSIPYFRKDLNIEVDLIEEIGRLYGFHNIEAKPLLGALSKGVKSKKRNYLDKLRMDLYALGFSEVLTYSFISEKVYDKLNIGRDSKDRDFIRIINPLGEDFSVMRTSLIGNMLDVIRKNLNNKQTDLRLSEVGNSFHKDESGKIIEKTLMTVALVGEYDFYYIKDVLLNIFKYKGIDNYKFVANTENPSFHQGRCANIFLADKLAGVIGEISPVVGENFDISKRVYIFEISVDIMEDFSKELIKYKKVSKYPLVERDIALVVDEKISSQEIINIIKSKGGEDLKFVDLFDIYTGAQIDDGKKSLAYKIGFQSDTRTLKDKEVKEAFETILDALNQRFNINLRS